MQKMPITVNGAKALSDELKILKSEKRPEVIAAIAEARAHGDLKENAEYHAAREQQSFIEGRIQELESTLADCQVIDPTSLPKDGRVVFGVTVDLLNIDTDEEKQYQQAGVSAVPAYIINQKYLISGAQEPDTLINAFREIADSA